MIIHHDVPSLSRQFKSQCIDSGTSLSAFTGMNFKDREGLPTYKN